MKKLFVSLLALVAMSVTASAAHVTINLVYGNSIEGELVSYNDTSVLIKPSNSTTGKEIMFKPQGVKSFYVNGIGRFVVVDNKFVPTNQTKSKLNQMQLAATERDEQNRVMAANPAETIGRALKSTGSACMGFGIPSAVVGAILLGFGSSASSDPSIYETKMKCSTAGAVLLPFGAALTIVGIPLHVHGKRIGELNFNYTGNGAAVAFNF